MRKNDVDKRRENDKGREKQEKKDDKKRGFL